MEQDLLIGCKVAVTKVSNDSFIPWANDLWVGKIGVVTHRPAPNTGYEYCVKLEIKPGEFSQVNFNSEDLVVVERPAPASDYRALCEQMAADLKQAEYALKDAQPFVKGHVDESDAVHYALIHCTKSLAAARAAGIGKE